MNEEKFHMFLNYMAAILLSLCFVGIIVMACKCFTAQAPQTHRIVITVSPDSVYDDAKFSYYTDSLISVINKHEHVIADRYEAILEDKADTQKYWSIAGILVSTILGIAGFFGFKSIKDIERDCKETAQNIAASTATSISTITSKEKTQEYLNANLKKEVKDASDVYFGSQEKHVSEMVKNAVANNLKDYSDNLEELTEEMEGIEERLDKIEQSINDDGNTNVSAPSKNNEQPEVSSVSGEINLFE